MTSQPAHIWWLSPFSPETATGLYYYRRRWYDAGTGGMISPDPLGFAAGDANLYRYCGNSPLSYTDPMGLSGGSGGEGYGGIWDAASGGLKFASGYHLVQPWSPLAAWAPKDGATSDSQPAPLAEPIPRPPINSDRIADILRQLPRLKKGDNWSAVEPWDDPSYNCIGHSLDLREKVEPVTDWGPNPFASMDAKYAAAGYTPSSVDPAKDPDKAFALEEGKQKVVLYAKPMPGMRPEVTHAAIQRGDGWWESKLGQSWLIRHASPDNLISDLYGAPVRVYERPTVCCPGKGFEALNSVLKP